MNPKNFYCKLIANYENNENYNLVLAPSFKLSKKTDISPQSQSLFNNFQCQKPIKNKEILSSKNNVPGICKLEKTVNKIKNKKMMKLIFNLWNEIVHTEKKFIKSKIIKISAYFRDFDAINSQFSDFLNQSKIEFNNLN